MKKIQLFILEHCPHCKKAQSIIAELLAEQSEFAGLSIQLVDEAKEAEYAGGFDYYYVPCFYVDGLKVHEGKVDKSVVSAVFEQALT